MYTEGPLGVKLKEAPKCVNWALMSTISKLLTFLGKLQNKVINVDPDLTLQKFFAFGMVAKEDKTLSEESKKWEPPQRRAQKIN
jgi:hypothetical protein